MPPAIEFVVYTGPSMNPTLVAPAMLEVRPYAPGESPRPGDVLFFHAPQGIDVVHRLVRITAQGLQTRGDNNPYEDPYCLPQEAVIGQVIAVQSGSRRRVVHGGRLGLWQAHWWWAWRGGVLAWLAAWLGPLYRGVGDWLAPHLPPAWQPQELLLRTPQGERRRLVWRGRMIGEFVPQRGEWLIRRPYRLVAGKWGQEARPRRGP